MVVISGIDKYLCTKSSVLFSSSFKQSTLIPAEVEAQGPALRAELHEEEEKRQLSKSQSQVVLEQQIPQPKVWG